MNQIDFKQVKLFPRKLTSFGLVALTLLLGTIVYVIFAQWQALQTIESKHLPIIERSAINVRLINHIEQQFQLLKYNSNKGLAQEIKLNFESLGQNYLKLSSITEIKSIETFAFYPQSLELVKLLDAQKFNEVNIYIENKHFVDNLNDFMFSIFDQTENLSNMRDKEQARIETIIFQVLSLGALVVIFLFVLLVKIYRGYNFNLKERLYAEEKATILSHQRQTLIHVLCHDLGNPVSAIFGLIEAAHVLPESAKEQMMGTIKSNSQAALDIIELTKKMQALETGKLSSQLGSVDLSASIEESLAVFDQKIQKKKLNIDKNYSSKVMIKAEKVSLVHSVLSNIISNSVKFLETGGKLQISTEDSDDFMHLVIKDDGIGMPKDILDNLFSETYATSRTGTSGEEGTGFGMPLVKKFVEAYGGSISVSSVQDQGTKTSIFFPK